MRTKQTLFLVYFNISLVCVLLVGLELTGQLAFYLMRGYPLYDSDRHVTLYENMFEIHPFLAGRLKSGVSVTRQGIAVTSTASHTRWTGAAEDDTGAIRVAVLGGSTTFGTRVTDADSWPAILQDSLGSGYAVVNFGVPGYTTAEAIVQMALIIPEMRPDIVVYYEGWNDLGAYHYPDLGPDYYPRAILQYSALGLPVQVDDRPFARLARVSALFKLAARLARPDPVEGFVRSDPDPVVDRLYLRNLGTLRLLAGGLGAHALFVPQVLNLSDFTAAGIGRPWSPHIEDAAMPGLLDRFNGFMHEACPAGQEDCTVVDEVSATAWSPGDFVDDGHFSRAGGERFVGMLTPRIRALGQSIERQ